MADTLNSLVGQTSGGMPDRVAALNEPTKATTDLLNQLVSMQDQMEKLSTASDNVPGAGDAMRSLPGILTALGSLGAAGLGDPQGGMAALEGFIGDAEKQKALEKASLGAKRDELMSMLDKQRQRLISVYQASPMSFLDPETGKSRVDPRALGYAMTGFILPIDPGVNYTLSKQTEATDFQVRMGTELILRGDTPEKRVQGGKMLNRALGIELDDEFYAAVQTMDQTDIIERLLSNPRLSQAHTLQMWRHMTQNGTTLADPKTVGMLAPAAPTEGNLSVDEHIMGLFANLSVQINAMGPEAQALEILDQIDLVYGGANEGEAALMKRHLQGTDAFGSGIGGMELAQMVVTMGDLYADVWKSTGGKGSQWLRNKGINTVDDIPRVAGEFVMANLGWAQRAQKDLHGSNEGIKLRDVASAIQKENPGIARAEAMRQAAGVLKQFRESSGVTSPSGRLDVDKYTAMVNTFIAGAKAPQGSGPDGKPQQ